MAGSDRGDNREDESHPPASKKAIREVAANGLQPEATESLVSDLGEALRRLESDPAFRQWVARAAEEALAKYDLPEETMDSLKRRAQSQLTGSTPGADALSGAQQPGPAWGGAEAEDPGPVRGPESPPRLRHRERAVSARDFRSIARSGFPKVGRATVAVGGAALVAVALSLWMLMQLRGPRAPDLTLPEPERKAGAGLAKEEAAAEEQQPGATVEPTADEAREATARSPAEIEVNFNADAYAIEAGECTTLRWDVKNARTVAVLGEQVEHLEAEEVCPRESSSYSLVANGEAGEVIEHLEIEVSEPSRDNRGADNCYYDANNQLICD